MKKFSTFLPSRTVIAVVVVPVVAIVLFFTFKSFLISPEKKQAMAEKELLATLEEELTNRDADRDGLQDWEERLYNTDAHKADTDSDGTLDGLEVQLGTDPLDPFNLKSKEKAKEIEKVNEDQYYYKNDPKLSQTDVFARDLFVKTIELKDANLVSNTSAQQQLTEELLKENSFVFESKYNEKDINTSSSTSKSSFKKQYQDVISRYSLATFRDEYFLFASYIETGDKQFLDELQKNIETYRLIEKDLLTVTIPTDAQALYLEYVNIFGQHNDSLEMLLKIDTDPVSTLNAVSATQEISGKLQLLAKNLGLYFSVNNI